MGRQRADTPAKLLSKARLSQSSVSGLDGMLSECPPSSDMWDAVCRGGGGREISWELGAAGGGGWKGGDPSFPHLEAAYRVSEGRANLRGVDL